MTHARLDQAGQTIIALLIFVMLATTLTATAAAITIINTRTNNSFIAGDQARSNAETGAENALRVLNRNSSYSGETMTLAKGTATITVSGTTTKTIISVGTYGNLSRTITVTAAVSTDNVVSLTSWSETP